MGGWYNGINTASSKGAIPELSTTHDSCFVRGGVGDPSSISRPACHFLLLTVFKKNGTVVIEFSNDT